jgi:beta-glucosidase
LDDRISRRAALGIAVAGVASATLRVGAAARTAHQFPRNFRWGSATAAHQVEGNNVKSDVWLFEGLQTSPFRERSGDACDSYHLYERDIELLAGLGLNTYRFGIEWARVEPEKNIFSPAILAHYGRMLDCCRRHGITTVVTLQHFTVPIWFAAMGGFENEEATAVFAAYAARVVQALGDRIDWICTINEANLSFGPAVEMRQAAAKAVGSENFSTFLFSDRAKSKPILREAHAAARRAIKSIKPTMPVGYTLAMDDIQDAPDAPGQGAKVRSEQYDVWLEAAREDDFVGVQTYTRTVVGANGRVPPAPGAPRTQVGQEYYPQALGGAVRYAARTARVPILVTENGIGIEDDRMRISYIDEALASLASVMDEGVDVRGYLHWSLLDNFEWTFGYGPKFGLVAVDRATQGRTPKPSALHYGRIAKANRM